MPLALSPNYMKRFSRDPQASAPLSVIQNNATHIRHPSLDLLNISVHSASAPEVTRNSIARAVNNMAAPLSPASDKFVVLAALFVQIGANKWCCRLLLPLSLLK